MHWRLNVSDPLSVRNYPNDPNVVYAYDPNNNPVSMQDGLGTTTWVYDDINRIKNVTDSLGREIGYAYDAVNLRTLTYPDERQVQYGYLENDWMESVTDPVGGVSHYTRDDAGRVIRTEHPNQTYSTRTYDRASRIKTVGNFQVGGDILSQFSYSRDTVGQITQATNTYGWRQPATVIETYTYDKLRRLTGVSDNEGMIATYEYDRASNRTLWQTNDDPFGQSPQDGFVAHYTYNAANQLTQAEIDRTPPSQSETVTYSYDANGNRINRLTQGNGVDEGTAYTFDDENRVASAYSYLAHNNGNRTWQDETTLAFDGNGRRLVESYDPHSGGGGLKRTEYVFSGLDPIAEYDQWNGHQRNYYRGESGHLIQLHHFPAGAQGQQYWYHDDGRWNVAGLTKQNGQSTHNYRYDAYGGVIPANGNFTQPHNDYTLTEKSWDDHAGLYYFGARHYDTSIGMWLTQDRFRGLLKAPFSLHRYLFSNASPISNRDLYGYCSEHSNTSAGCPNWMPDWAFDSGEAVGQFAHGIYDVTLKPLVDTPTLYAKYDCLYFNGACIPRSRAGEEAMMRDGEAVVNAAGEFLNRYAYDPIGSLSTDLQQIESYATKQPYRAAGNIAGTIGLAKLSSCGATQVNKDIVEAQAYGGLKGSLRPGMQAHHLNQNAAYRPVIPMNKGVAIPLEGSAITGIGASHFQFHLSLEKFWAQFRLGGSRFGQLPTNAEYSIALTEALRTTGLSTAEVTSAVEMARINRLLYGLTDTDFVPRIPDPLNQVNP